MNTDTQQKESTTKGYESEQSYNSIIIILVYGRSGSTFLASILTETVRSFYLFEPIRAVKYLKGSKGNNSIGNTRHL